MALPISRRDALKTACVATAGLISGAPFVHAQSKADSQPLTTGQGDYQYAVIHNWAQLPSEFTWQTTQAVVVDKNGFVYLNHTGDFNKKNHPNVFVFDQDGKYVRSFGQYFQGGAHGLELREENGEEFLYFSNPDPVQSIAKTNLKGELIWERFAPMESGIYPEGENTLPQRVRSGEVPRKGVGGPNRYKPTNIAFLKDGDLLVADGYGSNYIHRYTKDGEYKLSFAGAGPSPGKFSTNHGLALEARPGKEEILYVTDRSRNTIQCLTPEGKFVSLIDGFQKPCHVDFYKDLMLVPELQGRVTLLDGNNKVLAYLCDDHQNVNAGKVNRGDAKQWAPGKFVHPHDATFDHNGNIIVSEWVTTGRITLLKKLS
ncbi:NHL repeat containing protein [Planctopirus limnophila DSM 3776]|uniref:NHL repeat containing protein n=1 Tax=Planctopirus limnophila (strain ATCC 43296 / DSM 3776 / IFAM 1008 / Mu 290) TaxID=521674 RepID=D5SYW2_PLAL2|nr:twin-arginine translocation signal domain-containing protein [Planctopirus limnophila]ADG67894.1 NHL repeat containing protein [Planctopirus limnophila DSM 3776]